MYQSTKFCIAFFALAAIAIINLVLIVSNIIAGIVLGYFIKHFIYAGISAFGAGICYILFKDSKKMGK